MKILNGEGLSNNIVFENGEKFIYFFHVQDLESAEKKLNISDLHLFKQQGERSSKFESHKGFDFITLNIPNVTDIVGSLECIHVYLEADKLAFVSEYSSVIERLKEQLIHNEKESVPLEEVLFTFFNFLTDKDGMRLQDIEQEITDLENMLITSDKSDCTKEIIYLRKRLIVLKWHYESLFDIFTELEENQNELFSKNQLRYFGMLTNRADRLCNAIINLRDYVTQVREAYQAQVDISLNQTMKLFTVVTTIFLPLSLIAGWYGMNLKMPEYTWKYGYPTVILFSIVVAVGFIFYFKKHKWF